MCCGLGPHSFSAILPDSYFCKKSVKVLLGGKELPKRSSLKKFPVSSVRTSDRGLFHQDWKGLDGPSLAEPDLLTPRPLIP